MSASDWIHEFDDIRPYTDDELLKVLRRITRNRWLVSGVRRMRLPGCPGFLKPVVNEFIKLDLWRTLRRIDSVDTFQRRIIVDRVLSYIFRKTSDGITWSGMEKLERRGAYLFMSNHRDIVLDSAVLNFALAHSDLDIAEIAFGDNLLANEFVSDLIRVNRSFVVYRNLPVREQAKAAYKLSKYIRLTRSEGNSVWIAQREGRAKDGNDTTNPSIIKMLFMEPRRGGMKFDEFIGQFPIVPVAVSYEFDPCDRFKAREVYRRRESGSYEKRKSEDLISMYTGLKGEKGRIHLSIGDPVRSGGDARSVALEIDAQIHRLYRLWPSNYIAHDLLTGGDTWSDRYSPDELRAFKARFRTESAGVQRVAYEIYANALINQMKAGKR